MFPLEGYENLMRKKHIEYYQDGVILKSICLVDSDGKKQGPFIDYYPNGNVSKKGFYRDGKLSGYCQELYQNGQISALSFYKNGYPEGIQKVYYDNGTLWKEYICENGVKSGSYREYYRSGRLMIDCSFHNDLKNGQYYGYYDTDDSSHRMRKVCVFQDGVLNGPCTFYYPNGQVMEEFTQFGYLYEGNYKRYTQNGTLVFSACYKKGSYDGLYAEYTPKGKLIKKCFYQVGQLDGPYEMYHDNGQLGIKCFYVNGLLSGEYQSYHRNGREGAKATYENGKRIGLYFQKDKNGKIKEHGFYLGERFIDSQVAMKQRKKLNARLKQIDLQVLQGDLKRTLKRDLVLAYRQRFPNIKQIMPCRQVSKGKRFLNRAFSWLIRGSRD